MTFVVVYFVNVDFVKINFVIVNFVKINFVIINFVVNCLKAEAIFISHIICYVDKIAGAHDLREYVDIYLLDNKNEDEENKATVLGAKKTRITRRLWDVFDGSFQVLQVLWSLRSDQSLNSKLCTCRCIIYCLYFSGFATLFLSPMWSKRDVISFTFYILHRFLNVYCYRHSLTILI